MNRLSGSALIALLALVTLPAGFLAARAVWQSRPRDPVVSDLADGRRILSIPLERDVFEARTRVRRHLVSDGSVRSIPDAAIVRQTPSPGAWMIRTEEGLPLLGFVDGVVVGEGDTIRGDGVPEGVESMRTGLRHDRNRLVSEVRAASGTTGFRRSMERWSLFRAMDEKVGILLRDPTDVVTFVRLSSVREIDRPSTGSFGAARRWFGRILDMLVETPDSWGVGGLRQALVSTLVLILLSGSIGGTLALLAALLLHERLRPGRWAKVVRRSSEWLAAVPGVVWGGVGLGLLVTEIGTRLDAAAGRGLEWGMGGLLWASLTLGILAAPISLKRALEALESVPQQWRLVARSCGATRWQVLRMVVLPSVWPGLLGAWFSAFARAAGETAPLILVGAVHAIGGDVLEPGLSLPALSGGFPHLGVLACDPPWPPLEAELGHPAAYLSLFVLTLLCVGFELASVAFLGKGRKALEKEVAA